MVARQRPRKGKEVKRTKESQTHAADPDVVRATLTLFDPGGSLLRNAQELLAIHPPVSDDGFCPGCGLSAPCPASRHAAQVCRTAGLEVEDPRGAQTEGA
jgi:hypothetical protein